MSDEPEHSYLILHHSYLNPLPIRMNSEKPHSLGSLATRIVCTLIGVLLLYLLGYGPAYYIGVRYDGRCRDLILKLYDPLSEVKMPLPLERVLYEYVQWWMRLGAKHGAAHDYEIQIPPATP